MTSTNKIAYASLTLLAILFPAALTAQQGLSPSIQAELLRDKIVAEAKANDADGTLASLDQLHSLSDGNKVPFPPALYFLEAKAAHESGDANRALSALTQFLNNSDSGTSQHKEALALYPKFQQAVTQNRQLSEDTKRQALVARIPEVVAQIASTIVAEEGGQLVCPKPTAKAKLYCSKVFSDLRVAPFDVMNRCVPWFWWDVYAADTGRNSPYDELRGGEGCVQTVVSSFMETKDAPEPSNATRKDNIIPIADLYGFVEWISVHTGKHWRFLTDTEFELLAQRAINPVMVNGNTPVGQNPYPKVQLSSNYCTYDTDYSANTSTQLCNPVWELTNNCVSFDGDIKSMEWAGPSDCEQKAQIVVTLNDNLRSVITSKGESYTSESYSIGRLTYNGLVGAARVLGPDTYLNREHQWIKEIQFRLAREQ